MHQWVGFIYSQAKSVMTEQEDLLYRSSDLRLIIANSDYSKNIKKPHKRELESLQKTEDIPA